MEINIMVFLTIQLHNVLIRGVLPFDTSSIFLPYYGYFPCVLGHCVQYMYVCFLFVSIFSHNMILVHKNAYVILWSILTLLQLRVRFFLFYFVLTITQIVVSRYMKKMHSDGLTDTVIDSRKVQQYLVVVYYFQPLLWHLQGVFSLSKKKIFRKFF